MTYLRGREYRPLSDILLVLLAFITLVYGKLVRCVRFRVGLFGGDGVDQVIA